MKHAVPLFYPAASLALLMVLSGWSQALAQLSLNLSILDAAVTSPSRKASAVPTHESVSIRLGEPVSIRLEMVNLGTNAVQLMPDLNPAAGFVSLRLALDNAEAQRFTANRWEIWDYDIKRAFLAPGERLVHETFLYGKMGSDLQARYLFDREGTYLVTAAYAVPTPPLRVQSNPVRITVLPPVPAWEELKQAGIVALFEGRLRSRREETNCLARVRALTEAQPQHPLRTWLNEKAREFEPAGNRPP